MVFEFEQTPGDSEGQRSLAFCSPWGHRELDRTKQLKINKYYFLSIETLLGVFLLEQISWSFLLREWHINLVPLGGLLLYYPVNCLSFMFLSSRKSTVSRGERPKLLLSWNLFNGTHFASSCISLFFPNCWCFYLFFLKDAYLLSLTHCHLPVFVEDFRSWLIICPTTLISELSSMTSTSME